MHVTVNIPRVVIDDWVIQANKKCSDWDSFNDGYCSGRTDMIKEVLLLLGIPYHAPNK